jgi:hypothetical protein
MKNLYMFATEIVRDLGFVSIDRGPAELSSFIRCLTKETGVVVSSIM